MAILSAKQGVLTGPIKAPGGVWYSESGSFVLPMSTPAGYYVFELTSITPAGTRPGARGEIKKYLAQQLTARQESPLIGEKKWIARTTCRTGYVVQGCKEYKPPKPMAPKTGLPAKSPHMGTRKPPAAKYGRRVSTVPTPKRIIKLESPVVGKNHVIPTRYTCAGEDISLPLTWHGVPHEAKELILLVQGLGRGSPWAVARLSPTLHGIAAGALPKGAIVGSTGFGKASYAIGQQQHFIMGAKASYLTCPTKGPSAEYTFNLYALPRKLSIKPGFEPQELHAEIRNSSIAEGSFFAGILHKNPSRSTRTPAPTAKTRSGSAPPATRGQTGSSVPGTSTPSNGGGTPPVSGTDTAAITKIVQSYSAAVVADDGAKGCELLTQDRQKSLAVGSKSCAEALTNSCKQSAQEKLIAPTVDVTGVQTRVVADVPTPELMVSFTANTPFGVKVLVQDPVQREHGAWKLDSNGSMSWGTAGVAKTSLSKMRGLTSYCM